VQWGLRLLITEGSRLLELGDIRSRVHSFDANTLTYPWHHDDPAMDELQRAVMNVVGVRMTRSRREIFEIVCGMAGLRLDRQHDNLVARAAVPFLNEPWYC
jgi:hypothetical protein